MLEFELDKLGTEDGKIRYVVLRKGLQVGELYLDEEPYAHPYAYCVKMVMER